MEISDGEKYSPPLSDQTLRNLCAPCTLLIAVPPPLSRTLWQLLRELASTVASCVGAHMAHSLSVCDAILSAEGGTDTPDTFHSLLSLTQDFGDKVRPVSTHCSTRRHAWPVVSPDECIGGS